MNVYDAAKTNKVLNENSNIQLNSDVISRVNRALDALKNGLPIVMIDDADRENEGDVILAAQFASADNINFMIKHARGLICAPLTQDLATHLDLAPMYINNQDPHQTAFTVSVDFSTTTTGISANERALTLKALSDPSHNAQMFNKPGHIFPLIAKDGGVLERRGHTEAAVDLMKLAGLMPVAVICEILKEDGEMAREADLNIFCQTHELPFLSIEDLVLYRSFGHDIIELDVELDVELDDVEINNIKHDIKHDINKLNLFESLATAHLPTQFGDFDIIAFPNENGAEPHLALVKKQNINHEINHEINQELIDHNQAVLVRVHSECLTGDVFSSKKCDCEAQLHFGMSQIQSSSQPGVLIYLRQEGRGIGLIEKIKAYALQDQGQDTIQANVSLGHGIDERNFDVAAHILKFLNINNIELITNNPEKKRALMNQGINVVCIHNTPKFETPENRDYLMTKAAKMGHEL